MSDSRTQVNKLFVGAKVVACETIKGNEEPLLVMLNMKRVQQRTLCRVVHYFSDKKLTKEVTLLSIALITI